MIFLFGFLALGLCLSRAEEMLQARGEAFYLPTQYFCYDLDFVCPVLDGQPTLRYGSDCCYLPPMYSCSDNKLAYPPTSSGSSTSPFSTASFSPGASCTSKSTTLQLHAGPYRNYFYSNCNSATQVVVTSPELDSDLTMISPRIVVAWPAGNSGVVAYFAPENGINGTLRLQVKNSSSSSPLSPIYDKTGEGNATVGITAQVEFNSTAVLSVAILGSIRTIRDFTEGPSLLREDIQSALKFKEIENGVEISRLWLDNVTISAISFVSTEQTVKLNNTGNPTVTFEAGTYTFNATFDYPQLTPLSAKDVLSPESSALISQSPDQTDSLAFLSYTTKLTAGAWRFLTYFGRDSMITALLLEPVLSVGEGGALEAVIAGVLERINSTDGSACHEETIGDYATWLNLQKNITSTEPQCDYGMIDTEDFLPVLMEHYFIRNAIGSTRVEDFLGTTATIFPSNSNFSYHQLAQISAERIVKLAAPFAADRNQTVANLLQLKEGEIVGQWRDSTYGIGGGRIPFDVNTALVPAALRSIAALSTAGILDFDSDLISSYAKVWEDETLQFFEISLPTSEATDLLTSYAKGINVPAQLDLLDAPNMTLYAIALEGNNDLSKVAVMHTDDCFRHFLLNTTNEAQLTSFLNASANNVRRRFPAGLMTDVGMVVANPAYGDAPVYAENFTSSAYHGTVVWSWQLAMMARGLELQLSRCSTSSETPQPEFCSDASVYGNVKVAYNTLWDSLEENKDHLDTEVWSWVFEDGKFKYMDLGALPPPPGSSPTESNAVQLWSLTFLAVTRNEGFR